MAYIVLSQNNSVTTLEDDQGNVIHIPSVASLAKSTDYTILKVKNSTATLEDGDGNTYRDVPCVVVLADDSSSYTPIAQNNTKATLESSDNNIIHIPSKVVLASSTDFTIVKVNNSTATLEDGSGNIIRDVPCVSMLADESYSITKVNNSTATLSNDGKTIRDVPCIVILAKTSGAVEVIIKGTSPLNLPDAIADSLSYVKAFGGTEQRNLPDNYIQRQFIYMLDGSYIWTDIVPESGGKVEMDFQTTTTAAQIASYLGAREPSSPAGNGLRLTHGSTVTRPIIIYGFEEGGDYQASAGFSNNTRYKFTYDNGVATVYSGDTLVTSHTFTPNSTCTTPLVINGTATTTVSGNIEGIYLYSFKVWNTQGDLVADYVPAVQKGTVPVVGFYDTVSGTFKTATAGTFAAGGEVVPTPDAPMDIITNNGTLKFLRSATGSTTQAGTSTPTNPIPLVSYQQNDLVLRGVGAYADVYNSSTQTVTRSVDVKIFDGTEIWTMMSGDRGFAYGAAANDPCRVGVPLQDEAMLCTHFNFVKWSNNNLPMPLNSIGYNINSGTQTTNGNITICPDASVYNTVDKWKTWLAEQYANGTPVIAVRIATESTETVPNIYTDGTVETISAHGKNLLDMADENLVTGKYINNDGTIQDSSANFYNKKYIRVFGGQVYTWSASESIRYTSISEYDSSQTFLRRTLFGTSSTAAGTSDSVTLLSQTAFVRFGSNIKGNVYVTKQMIRNINWQFEKGSTATEYQPYYDGGTATAEMLLKVGDYQDEQEILSGAITRNVGIKVLDGTEVWSASSTYQGSCFATRFLSPASPSQFPFFYCSHFEVVRSISDYGRGKCLITGSEAQGGWVELDIWYSDNRTTAVEDLKAYLADQYAAGTPVIIVYPLATATTESVAGQTLQVTDGDNVLEITQASLDNLELEAQYQAAVQLTIQEVEDANLDNNVEVTIS